MACPINHNERSSRNYNSNNNNNECTLKLNLCFITEKTKHYNLANLSENTAPLLLFLLLLLLRYLTLFTGK